MKDVPDRNGPCPCGSGKKYKNCCINKEFIPSSKSSRRFVIGVILLVVALAAGAAILQWSKQDAETVELSTVPVAPTTGGPPFPQPPGPVPPGKVWSPDHGHWHNIVAADAAGAGDATASPPSAGFKPGPPPPGPAPAGKVWSFDHGHWHDAPAGDTVVTVGGADTSDATESDAAETADASAGSVAEDAEATVEDTAR